MTATERDEQASASVPGCRDRQTGAEGREWVLDFAGLQQIVLNGPRGNHFVHARKVRELRERAALQARLFRIPRLDRVQIELHYAPKDKRRRDPMNWVPTRKAIEDGITDAGVIPDDTPEFSVPTVPVIDAPTGKPGRVYVIVREVA